MTKLEPNSHQQAARRKSRLLIIRAVIALVLGAMVIVAGDGWRVRAATNRFVSTTGNDQGGSNDCASSGQPCKTIQNAINHSGGGDEIDLGPGAYVENVTVDRNVTVRGDAISGSTVDGNQAGSVFVINSGVSASLDMLTITNGKALAPSEGEGGGVWNNGNLTVTQCAITDNSAPQTTVVSGSITTTFFGFGGGIANRGNLTVVNSTFKGNSADDFGGAISNNGSASLVNCTISENRINVLSLSGGGVGGVYNNGSSSVLSLTNNIISGNVSGDCDSSAGLAKNDRNFIGDGRCSPALSGNPMLGPFQNNGGPTFTFALHSGSPAVDAGDDSVLSSPLNLTTDQRGAGFPRLGCAHVDIGAYEVSSNDPPAIACPGDIFAVTDPGQSTATVTLTATGTDACGGPLTPAYKIGSMVITSPHTFPVGGTSVTATVTDAHGRTASCSFFVFVHCVAPTISCPGNISVFTDPGKTTASVAFGAAASDPCDGALAPLYSANRRVITSPFDFPVGTTSVTASVSNTGGTASCSFTVTVVCAPPIVTCPSNIAVYSDPGRNSATVVFAATASDACDGMLAPVYTIGNKVISSPYAFPPGLTTVTAMATGSNGLTGGCTFTVNVTLLDKCIQDDHSGDTFRFNSTTGQYLYTRCRDKFAMSGTGVVGTSSGLATLTDTRPDRRISAAANPGTLTGRANITLILAPGVYQAITVNQTNPSATCACP